MFEHTDGVIRGCKSKDRKYNDKKEKEQKTKNDPQNIMQKTKDCER